MGEEVIYGRCAKCGGPLLAGHECSGTFQDQAKAIAKLVVETAKRKPNHIGAPACFRLELACQHLRKAFGHYGIYQVGSSLDRADWRDVDVRYILEDSDFAALFPDAGDMWEQDARWLILTCSISAWLSEQAGLPVDFQFQSQTHANARHKGPRNAIGIVIAKGSQTDRGAAE